MLLDGSLIGTAQDRSTIKSMSYKFMGIMLGPGSIRLSFLVNVDFG